MLYLAKIIKPAKTVLFNSPVLIFIFLPVTLVGFYLLGRWRAEVALGWLVMASLFFYAWWNPSYLLLILASMTFNFHLGKRLSMSQTENQNTTYLLLALGITANLGLLAYYKYFNFFIDNINTLFDASWNFETIILPLAISFFTFQQITFLVDASRGETRDYSFNHYALFVTFFPQLIAGPIVHHSEIMPQFLHKSHFSVSYRNLAVGLSIFLIGLFKKVVLADNIAVFASPVFDAALNGNSLSFFEAWGGTLAYTFQLYFDFSGYSDMAIGLARMFGITLPLNFNSPYKAYNIIDFWRRWHMTLSRFLRDYVYIPLGGNRQGKTRRYVNLITTMLLGGLWHGAGWTFVIWGGLHGLYLMINHAWQGMLGRSPRSDHAGGVRKIPGVVITFAAVMIAWVYFRAESFEAANNIVLAMSGTQGFLLPADYEHYLGVLGDWLIIHDWRFETDTGTFQGNKQIAWLLLESLIIWGFPNTQQFFGRFQPALNYSNKGTATWQERIQWYPCIAWGLATVILGSIALLSLNRVSEFLYFQF